MGMHMHMCMRTFKCTLKGDSVISHDRIVADELLDLVRLDRQAAVAIRADYAIQRSIFDVRFDQSLHTLLAEVVLATLEHKEH